MATYSPRQSESSSYSTSARSWACRVTGCNYSSQQKYQRNRHEIHYHPARSSCTAPGCTAVFDNEHMRRMHMLHHETQGRRYLCNARHCTERFQDQATQFQHEVTMHARSICNICSLSFPSIAELADHAFHVHSPPNQRAQIRCSACRQRAIRTLQGMGMHMNEHNAAYARLISKNGGDGVNRFLIAEVLWG
jgi:hypothetical protein